DGWAALPLAGPGVQVCALGADAVQLRERLRRGEEAAGVSPPSGPDGSHGTPGAETGGLDP
ncbi:hypothetical protein AB0J37_27640, partial [Microbispora rosea]